MVVIVVVFAALMMLAVFVVVDWVNSSDIFDMMLGIPLIGKEMLDHNYLYYGYP